MSMFSNNFKMAIATLRANKWRSFLTMLGIIIGVLSVVTTVSIGQGVKQEINQQISHTGPDLITVRPGNVVNRDEDGNVVGYNLLSLSTAGTLTERDLEIIKRTPGVNHALPMMYVSGELKTDERAYGEGLVVGVTPEAPGILNQKVAYGTFFSSGDSGRNIAVIGPRVAERLLEANVPLGRAFDFRGETFVVGGVFEEFHSSPLTPAVDYNNAVFIPFERAQDLVGDQTVLYQILVQPMDGTDTVGLSEDIDQALLASRANQRDFTILRQEENLVLANTLLNLLTTMIAGVAAISLLVGGIGVMNIMLVSVTERMHEIGVRKAVGATNQQILSQFLIEAVVLSLTGGVLGVIGAILANYLLRILTDLQPVVTLPIVLLATGVSVVVGVIFGVTPALRAARKDPIDALRHD